MLRHIAIILLLLFFRVMIPDTLLVQLHPHTHTVHTEQTDTHKAQIGLKHKHCSVEELFGAPYQLANGAIDFNTVTHFTKYTASYHNNWQTSPIRNTTLRGPPLA